MNKLYTWSFSIEEIRNIYIKSPNCPECMTADNVEAWRRYVSSKISELMKDETMQKPEFQKILEQVKEEKRRREDLPRRGF